MEAEVIQFPKKKVVKPPMDWGPQFYCLRCDGGEFRLYASGMVHCAHCGSMMRNLLAQGVPPEAS